MTNEEAHINDGLIGAFQDPIPRYMLQGYSATNRITFTLNDFYRETVLDMKAFAIMQSNTVTFKSDHYSGYLGLAPYSSDNSIQEENIFYHLKHEGIIDHAIVSLYLKKEGHSFIKFGSYDKEALYNHSDFTVLKTIGKDSWAIRAVDPEVNGMDVQTQKKDIDFLIDP